MEGLFCVGSPNAIGAFSILLQIEVRCPIAPSRHRGRPKNTPPIMSSEIVMGRGWRISTTKTNLADDRLLNYLAKTRRGGLRPTSRSCGSWCAKHSAASGGAPPKTAKPPGSETDGFAFVPNLCRIPPTTSAWCRTAEVSTPVQPWSITPSSGIRW
jgi:hypothetical protein